MHSKNPCGDIPLPVTFMCAPIVSLQLTQMMRARYGLPLLTPEEWKAQEAVLTKEYDEWKRRFPDGEPHSRVREPSVKPKITFMSNDTGYAVYVDGRLVHGQTHGDDIYYLLERLADRLDVAIEYVPLRELDGSYPKTVNEGRAS